MTAPFDAERTAAEAVARAQMAPDAKRPLYRELPPAPAFPVDALGALRQPAEAVHMIVQAPLGMCAQSVLAAATLAIQPHHDVDLPYGRRPLTGLFISVGESGERKTSVDRLALRAVKAAEQKWAEAFEAERQRCANDREVWEHARQAAKKTAKGNRVQLRRLLEEIGSEPKLPASPMLVIADPTPEALVMHLAERPWGGVFTSEGGILIGGFAFNDETRMRTGALLNVLWDGEAIRRRRVGTGAHFLPGRRCSAHVMMQHTVAGKLFGDATLDGIGTLARMLLVDPESTIGLRVWRDPDPAAIAALADYDNRLSDLLARPQRLSDAGGLDPTPLALDRDARTMWTRFHDAVERAQGAAGALAGIRAFASKMPEHAGRLAAVLAIYGDSAAGEISAEAMAGGIALAQHYAAELERLKGAAVMAPDLKLAQRLLAWWQARPQSSLHLAAIYQRGLNAIGDAATARRIVGILDEHGWVRRLPPGTELDGVPRRDAWQLLP